MYNQIEHLKSNMDRFIAIEISPLATGGGYLKSNMDRFIVVTILLIGMLLIRFKIQYG